MPPFSEPAGKPLQKALRRGMIYSLFVVVFVYVAGVVSNATLVAIAIALLAFLTGAFYLDESGQKKRLSQLLIAASVAWLVGWLMVIAAGRMRMDSPSMWGILAFIATIPLGGIWLGVSDLSGRKKPPSS